jgi:hypothetical protein
VLGVASSGDDNPLGIDASLCGYLEFCPGRFPVLAFRENDHKPIELLAQAN